MLFAAAALLCVAAMFAVWLIAVRIDNYSIVDIAWSVLFLPVAVLYAVFADGLPARRAVLAALVGAWSLRLGLHLFRRIRAHHPREDTRYAALRAQWAGALRVRFLVFFLAQGISVPVLAIPFLLVAGNARPGPAPLEVAGALLFLAALAGEAVADRQLAAFKADPAHRGLPCDIGLWRFSRHPNYFCEWLVWCAWALLALPAAHGWIALGAPALMLYLLLEVTGVKPSEEQALRTRGDAYRAYQSRTSRFLPWFPR
jgi:steroid 5-alpha reductase family enzyme